MEDIICKAKVTYITNDFNLAFTSQKEEFTIQILISFINDQITYIKLNKLDPLLHDPSISCPLIKLYSTDWEINMLKYESNQYHITLQKKDLINQIVSTYIITAEEILQKLSREGDSKNIDYPFNEIPLGI